ncbi:P-loop NTPase family protein [Chitinophaga vietnamensis]|uniref:hypothetical protein n=1 Tax=Chitinophaga vietnamensis TaxID=2593957 RepID=UPI0011776D44|nr:hypothetical protein [Chitinophaga vietnamensis]
MHTRIKKTIICKNVDLERCTINKSKINYYIPQVGDVAIFEIISIGKHKRVQADDKLNVLILPGDLIMGAFGTRYASAQFEGYVPADCRDTFHILGAGGTIGVVESMHDSFSDVGPTVLRIVGYVTNQMGNIVNTRKISRSLIPFSGIATKRSNIILSIGSSMDSGKTTTAAYIVRGLKTQGHKVAFIKLTGTVYTKDRDMVYDCGADITADFSDFGFPSTYMCPEQELLDLFESLMQDVMTDGAEHVVVEIADGILQRETKMLLENKHFMSLIGQVIFSCCDSLSALYGIDTLKQIDIYPTALSGLFTASPLLVKEVKGQTQIPVVTIAEWMEGKFNHLFKWPMVKYA